MNLVEDDLLINEITSFVKNLNLEIGEMII